MLPLHPRMFMGPVAFDMNDEGREKRDKEPSLRQKIANFRKQNGGRPKFDPSWSNPNFGK